MVNKENNIQDHLDDCGTIEEYINLQQKFDDPVIYNQEFNKFYEEHPDAPRPKPIEKLSLVMKKVFAEQIISGEKKIEIRAEGPKYYSMMMDHDTIDYMEKNADDELMFLKMFDFMYPTRPVKTIHFYTYNNSWSMDVECEYNWKMAVTDKNVNDLHEMYDCHEFDELLEELNAQNIPEENRPVFYCFAIGNIIERRNI